ncbi:MAG: glycosyltransferase family 4 protein [Anaerolineae bacterium]|nr:glycosyltransferase family 4 protein [Anaerolineae bacterium]
MMVITQFYPRIGGAERQLMLLGRELQTLGVEIQVITARFPGLLRKETVHGLPIVRLPSPGRGGRWARWGNLVFLAQLAVWLVWHRREYEIIHAHIVSVAACLVVGIGRVLGKGTVVKVANSGPYSDFRRSLGRHRFLDRLFLRVLKQVDVIISISNQVRADLGVLDFSPDQIVDIPNGVLLKSENIAGVSKSILRRQLGLPEGPLVLCVASLHPKKGLDVLIRTWQKVDTVVPQAQLIILGEGPQRTVLETMVMQNNLADQIHLPGWVEKVPDYLRVADLFVLPSRAEGLSNALLEAMAAGLPIVATRVGGTADVIISGENGLLVPPDDAIALSEALLSLFQDPTLQEQLGRAARRTVETRYAILSVATHYLELYHRLADE